MDASYTSSDDEIAAPPSVVDDDNEGSEVESGGRKLSSIRVQRELSRLADCTKLRALENTLKSQSNWEQLERLRDLRHPEVSHRWLWNLDSKAGSVLAQPDYVLDVQKRLGARIFNGSATCHLCGAPLDPCLSHAETCALAEATRGHYACVRALVNGFRPADPSVTTEPRGLTDAQSRPADIFTTAAVPGRSQRNG